MCQPSAPVFAPPSGIVFRTDGSTRSPTCSRSSANAAAPTLTRSRPRKSMRSSWSPWLVTGGAATKTTFATASSNCAASTTGQRWSTPSTFAQAAVPNAVPSQLLRWGTSASNSSTSSTFWTCITRAVTGSPTKTARSFRHNAYSVPRGALGLLVQSLFYVDWHMRARTCTNLDHHYNFAVEMGRRMQSQGLRLAERAGPDDFEELDFILSDVSVVCMNWDPVGLWAQFVANRSLNRASNVPYVGSPARRMQLYHDLGYFVAGPRVQKDHPGSKVWQPMNISSARQLNDRNHGANVRIRVSKHLFPHGCLWWRECPNCGKLSSYIGDAWDLATKSLLPPPPLKAFADTIRFDSWRQDNRERWEWDLGKVDARACVHCKTLTYAHHTPVVMQTSFKTPPPPFLEEIQREMRVVVQEADHIVLMGYSLPLDDVTYRAFLAARIRKHEDRQVRCSVVDKQDGYESRWLYPEDLQTMSGLPEVVLAARELFRPNNVRYFGAGIPEVFLGGGATVTADSVDRLLRWES